MSPETVHSPIKLKTTIKKILTGTGSKKEQGFYLFFYLFIYYLLLFISFLLFPSEYSIFSNFISTLGTPYENPNGFIIFTIAEVWNGLLSIPNMYYYYRRLSDIEGKRERERSSNNGKQSRELGIILLLNKIAITFGVMSSIGTIFCGLIPQDFTTEFSSNLGHLIAVYISFTGIYCGFFVNAFIFYFRKRQKLSWPKSSNYIVIHLQTIIASVIFAVVSLANNIEPNFLSLYFWEWMTIFSITLWVIGIYILIPSEKKKKVI